MTTTVQVRIEKGLKEKAQKTLAALGLDLSSGVKLFLTQVVNDQELPFTPCTGEKAKAIRVRWDRGIAEAIKSGRRYMSAKELLDDLEKGL